MNEQTVKLIETLAAKLGTTAEHLWGVLVRQAPISASWQVVSTIVEAIILIAAIRGFRAAFVKLNDADYDKEVRWIATCIACGVVTLLFGISTLYNIAVFDDALAGFFNPEYWALRQIIK